MKNLPNQQKDEMWLNGYNLGARDCAADYECGIRSTEREQETLKNSNGLLRSMSSIVKRKGKEVNWETFGKRLDKELKRQHRLMYPESYSKSPLPEKTNPVRDV